MKSRHLCPQDRPVVAGCLHRGNCRTLAPRLCSLRGINALCCPCLAFMEMVTFLSCCFSPVFSAHVAEVLQQLHISFTLCYCPFSLASTLRRESIKIQVGSDFHFIQMLPVIFQLMQTKDPVLIL